MCIFFMLWKIDITLEEGSEWVWILLHSTNRIKDNFMMWCVNDNLMVMYLNQSRLTGKVDAGRLIMLLLFLKTSRKRVFEQTHTTLFESKTTIL